MPLLSETERNTFLAVHPAWQIDGKTLARTFRFSDFVEAMGFVTRVGIVAEKAFHHPDIDIRWNEVTITLTTHDEGGLTEKDTALATELDRLG
jgi:4a-hydroxytetrahydrobiopterin dehydratase